MIYLHYKDTKTFGHSFSFLLIFKTLRASYLQVGNFSLKITFKVTKNQRVVQIFKEPFCYLKRKISEHNINN